MTSQYLATADMILNHCSFNIRWSNTSECLRKNKHSLSFEPSILAVFDDGGILLFEEIKTHYDDYKQSGADVFALSMQCQFEEGDRIEVRSHTYSKGKTRIEQRSTGNGSVAVWTIDYADAQGTSIVLMKSDGSIVRLVRSFSTDDVNAANMAVKLRKVLEEICPPVASAAASSSKVEGFDL